GSVEVFAQNDGSVGSTRRVFMTQSKDPQGNALTFTYDAQLRLVSVTDAIGQVTTLSYELPQDIWKLTRVTDPFGRSATFSYDESGQLRSSTDTLGMTSWVTYGGDGSVSSITTPYGATRFGTTEQFGSTYSRTVETTDPLGAKERVEYRQQWTPPDAAMEPPAPSNVSGITFSQSFLQYRNTLYWDKRA